MVVYLMYFYLAIKFPKDSEKKDSEQKVVLDFCNGPF